MKSIIKTCLNSNNKLFYDDLTHLLDQYEFYKREHKISILSTAELDFVRFLINSFDNSKQFPSEKLFLTNFTYLGEEPFRDAVVHDPADFLIYISNFIANKVSKSISMKMLEINSKIEEEGFTEEHAQKIADLQKISSLNRRKEVDLSFNFRSVYNEKLSKPLGMTFGIKVLDERIGGMEQGSLNTIAGFTSHFKSALALNLIHHNVFNDGYNIVLVSLETPKEDIYANLLSIHSFDNAKFPEFGFISHTRIKQCLLSDDERDYLFDKVEKDWLENKRGELVILDESDFDTMSFGEIHSMFEDIDTKLENGLDAFVIDYIQLLKFSGADSRYMDDNRVINSYVSFFRRLAINFRSRDKTKKLVGVILSQINRDSWKKAKTAKGEYNVTCLADANELERGSYRVFTIYTDEEMKASKEVSLQILKNRTGPNMYTPEVIYADGESLVISDDSSGFGSPMIAPAGKLGDMMGSLDF